MKPVLYVGNRNYSSWSMRPWLVLRWAGIEFETRVIPLGGAGYMKRQMPSVLAVSPSGAVPVLHLGDDQLGDSLAISEWAAERTPSLWPADELARFHARSATAEMHSGFAALRAKLPCNIRRRTEPRALDEALQRDVERIERIWTELSSRFGGAGPYLFGSTPTVADAFFTPVATRFRTYGVSLSPPAQRYADALLRNPAFTEWEREALEEPWTMPEWDSV